MGGGYSVSQLHGDGGLCVSAVSPVSKGTSQDKRRQSNVILVAPWWPQKILDKSITRSCSGLSKSSSSLAKASKTAKTRQTLRSGGISSLTRLAIVRKAITRAKFSAKVSEQIAN